MKEVHLRYVNLNEKARNVIKDISTANSRISEKRLTIQFLNDKIINRNDGIEYFVNADKSRIFQVLSNLINNAIKFSSTNGVISISLTKAASLVPENNKKDSDEAGHNNSIRIRHLRMNMYLLE